MRVTQALTINPAYNGLVHPLTQDEYNDLKKSIEANGQYLPIITNKNGIILDGHHRWRICRELGIKPKSVIKEFASNLHEKLFVIESNLSRRQLNSFQRIELALKTKPILEEIARKNSTSNLPNHNKISSVRNKSLGRVDDQIGKRAKTGRDTVRKVEYILKKADKYNLQRIRSGEISINEGYGIILNQEKRHELMNLPVMDLSHSCKLHLGDFMDIKIQDSSIHLIFTDPPYIGLDKSLDIYRKLGQFAHRVLVDGGSLVTFVGTYDLPKFLSALLESGLRYWWLLCVKHRGQHSQMFQRKVFVDFKPLLWMVKGKKTMDGVQSLHDFIESPPNTKEYHKWQQSPQDAEEVISKLTLGKNSIVLDPFCGSGSFGVAALGLGRKFIGIEQEKAVFELAKRRISKYLSY